MDGGAVLGHLGGSLLVVVVVPGHGGLTPLVVAQCALTVQALGVADQVVHHGDALIHVGSVEKTTFIF